MKRSPDFSGETKSREESFYDLREDWSLIESSIAKQYGIRMRASSDMRWGEFSTLISGLMADTPLGQIISIRAEKDYKVIKSFSAEQKRIYNEWRTKTAKKKLDNPEKLAKEMEQMAKTFQIMFG